MRSRCVLVVFLLALAIGQVFGQRKVDASNMYERLLCIVPMVGRGTWDDPKRPMNAPLPTEMKPGDRTGIIAYHFEASDDGNLAIVEFVTANRAALTKLRTAIAPGAQVFERGKNGKSEIETAFRAVKRNFDLAKFAARVQ